MSNPKIWIKVALINFLMAISIGALLRFAFVYELEWMHFKHFLHAHSHVAMLGWVYQALFCFLVINFIPKEKGYKKYGRLFWLTQLSVWGMLISFCLQGYGLVSIACSTLHIILSYFFIYYFFIDTWDQKKSTAIKFVRVALIFQIISTLGIWAMMPIMKMQLQGEAIYYMSIQFYLHFQFNGWFIFAILGLIFKLIENIGLTLPTHLSKPFLRLLFISCFLTYALAVTWSDPLPFLFYINGSGVIIQLLSLGFFLAILKINWQQLKTNFQPFLLNIFSIALLAFILKILIQTAVVIPKIAVMGYTLRNFAMGFLHLMLIGMASFFLLGLGYYQHLLRNNNAWNKPGIIIFFIGFLGSEFLLFFQGLLLWNSFGFLPYYYEMLFGFSALLPLCIFLILLGQFRGKNQEEIQLF